jgi:acyl-CoA reductase-like NAD-dependent aldehyde dehydrogenase
MAVHAPGGGVDLTCFSTTRSGPSADDAFLDKAIEGLVLYAFNKGEVCTCPSRALIHESIYDEFMGCCLERIAAIKQATRWTQRR